MKGRKLFWIALGCTCGLALVFLLRQALRPGPPAIPQIFVSQPALAHQRTGEGTQPTIALVISNAGPGDVDFCVPWIETRNATNLHLLPAKPPRRGRSMPLFAGCATNVVIELGTAPEPGIEPLFCGQVHWQQRESKLRGWARQIDQPLYWLGAWFDFNWNPPWRNKPFYTGEVFASNVGTAAYFNRVYGFTRERWLEEEQARKQREAKEQEERARLPDSVQPGTFMRRFGIAPGGDAEEQVRLDAAAAFADFCRSFTNAPVSPRR